VHFKRSCDGVQRIDTSCNGTILDLREMSAANLGHVSQLRLGKSMLFPYVADFTPQALR